MGFPECQADIHSAECQAASEYFPVAITNHVACHSTAHGPSHINTLEGNAMQGHRMSTQIMSTSTKASASLTERTTSHCAAEHGAQQQWAVRPPALTTNSSAHRWHADSIYIIRY